MRLIICARGRDAAKAGGPWIVKPMIKRYLVAHFRGQVGPAPESASVRASKEVVTQVVR
jgi:hypothetical protein